LWVVWSFDKPKAMRDINVTSTFIQTRVISKKGNHLINRYMKGIIVKVRMKIFSFKRNEEQSKLSL
jgi:hypothetical protein